MVGIKAIADGNKIDMTDSLNDSELQNKWNYVANCLLQDVGDAAFKSWVAPIEVRAVHSGVLEIAVATRFIKDWVKTHYSDKIRKLWSDKFDNIRAVEITVCTSCKKEVETPANKNTTEASSEDKNKPLDISSPLDPRFTFENFVVGKPNELAYAAAQRVVASKEVSFNPLFLYGGVGLGKTHLMHAIAWAIRETKPERRVVYMSAEKFMYQFVRALRCKDTMAFKENFRSVDVLMIDDIQFICGKDSTQEEFFHTFNSLIDQNKQIIVSADK